MSEPVPDSKVLFRVPREDGAVDVETLWATSVGKDQYQLNNSPFYCYGVSWFDIVLAPFDEEEGFPTFQKVVTKSGHRTIRVVFDPPIEDGNTSDQLLKGLLSLGCTYEGANRAYVAIDVPPGVDLQNVRLYLMDSDATWEHADPTYDALFPEEA